MKKSRTVQLFVLLLLFFANATFLFSQTDNNTIPPLSKWGQNDTILSKVIFYNDEWLTFKELEIAWVSNLSDKKLTKFIQEWTRLRNAVYVTYPYARTAGVLMNDINLNLSNVSDKKERKKYIKAREGELRDKFGEPLTNLSVYQGKILMKLINRQTGNNCYEIIKEYRGGVAARLYQTVAFFFGSSLKQEWDLTENVDKQIEGFVKEIDGVWYTGNLEAR